MALQRPGFFYVQACIIRDYKLFVQMVWRSLRLSFFFRFKPWRDFDVTTLRVSKSASNLASRSCCMMLLMSPAPVCHTHAANTGSQQCKWTSSQIFTHRRSVAKRGGCFQRRLFVCLFVSAFVFSLSVRTKTSEGLNVGGSNLAVRLVSWSWTSLFSTNTTTTAISETKGQGWRVIRVICTQWRIF